MIRVVFLTLFALIILNGCCDKEIVYKDRWKDRPVPMPCKVPDVNCTWSGNNSMLSAQMYSCILNYKEAVKVCQ